MSNKYDVIVIGAGPAGYVAAIRAAQLGMQVGCIDRWLDDQDEPSLGGTCLNAGCIPSKALLESSELYHRAHHDFAEHGLDVKNVSMDIGRMQKRREKIVSQLTGGIAGLFKANGVEWLQGSGSVADAGKVEFQPVGKNARKKTLEADNIIIASGSEPVALDIAPFDGERILDSRGALTLPEVPKRLGVIGAGYIGVELGSVWSRLGAETVILEAQESFMPIADNQIAREALRQFGKQGMDIRLGARVVSANAKTGKSGNVTVRYSVDGDEKEEVFDRLIVAVGRRPCTDGLLGGDAQVELDDKGFVSVDGDFRTSLPGVYAVGDVIGGPMLAHKGMEEGSAVAEILAGQKPHVNYETVPCVVYTSPEIAWVGKTEAQAKSEGIDYRVGAIPFAANGRAKALGQEIGQVKLIADANTDRILGAHMIGPYVSELIQEIVVAMEFQASSEDIARIIHGHPTLGENVHEAALAVDGRPIHFAPKKRK